LIYFGLKLSKTFLDFADSVAVPDIITMSKALGGIGLPLSAIIHKKEIDVWVPG
jgi:diaminobutyrate-2-oxoglutarate transaminase